MDFQHSEGPARNNLTTIGVGKPDPSMMCNSMLAGLVAITAPCAFVTPVGAFAIGAIAGVLDADAGEVPLALTVYNYKAEQLKGQGAPIEWFALGKAVARANGIAVMRRAPHPHAAVLFYDFEISEEGQRILVQRDFVPTNRKVETPLNKLPLMVVDPKVMLDEQAKWSKLYEELFVKQR